MLFDCGKEYKAEGFELSQDFTVFATQDHSKEYLLMVGLQGCGTQNSKYMRGNFGEGPHTLDVVKDAWSSGKYTKGYSYHVKDVKCKQAKISIESQNI